MQQIHSQLFLVRVGAGSCKLFFSCLLHHLWNAFKKDHLGRKENAYNTLRGCQSCHSRRQQAGWDRSSLCRFFPLRSTHFSISNQTCGNDIDQRQHEGFFFHLNLKSGTKTGLLLYYLIRSVAGVELIPMH